MDNNILLITSSKKCGVCTNLFGNLYTIDNNDGHISDFAKNPPFNKIFNGELENQYIKNINGKWCEEYIIYLLKMNVRVIFAVLDGMIIEFEEYYLQIGINKQIILSKNRYIKKDNLTLHINVLFTDSPFYKSKKIEKDFNHLVAETFPQNFQYLIGIGVPAIGIYEGKSWKQGIGNGETFLYGRNLFYKNSIINRGNFSLNTFSSIKHSIFMSITETIDKINTGLIVFDIQDNSNKSIINDENIINDDTLINEENIINNKIEEIKLSEYIINNKMGEKCNSLFKNKKKFKKFKNYNKKIL